MVQIYPAIMGLAEKEVQKFALLSGVCNQVHIDIMDNVFVPNVTQGVEGLADYIKNKKVFPWLHLMVQHPLPFYMQLELEGDAMISFHFESVVDIFEMIKKIKEKKQQASLAISPKTPIGATFPFLGSLDQVLVMSVEPGFSGQPFLCEVTKKIEELVLYRKQQGLDFRIALDGGINKCNIGLLAKMGVDDCAVSSGIFAQKNPVTALRELYEIVNK